MKIVLSLAVIWAAAAVAAAGPQAGAPFTNRLAVEFRHVIDPAGFALHAPRFSRDRSRYALVARQPSIVAGAIEFQLHSLETEAVRRYLTGEVSEVPRARLLATLRSRSARPAITQVKWLPDNKSLAFLGESEDGKTAVYAVDTSSGTLTQLVSHPARIRTFDTDGSTVVFIAEVPRAAPPLEEIITVTDQRFEELMKPAGVPENYYAAPDSRYQTYVVARPGGAATAVPRSLGRKFVQFVGSTSDNDRKVWLSPDAKLAVELRYVNSVPRDWERLSVMPGRLARTEGEVGESRVGLGAFRFVVVDLRTGDLVLDLAAPTGVNIFSHSPVTALWAQDSRSLVLTNTFVADDAVEGREGPPRPAIVDVDIASNRQSVIFRLPARDENDEGSIVHADRVAERRLELVEFPGYVFTKTTPEARIFERLPGGEWRERDKAPYSVPFWARRTEDFHNPMQYVATWTGSTAPAKPIFETNPQLEGVEIVPTEAFDWQDSRGERWKATLLVPERCRGVGGCPLVIQTHGYSPRFITDGPVVYANTAYAARALASEGFVVLQMEDRMELQNGPEEAERYLDAYRTGVARLQTTHRIDSKRVGAVGFSRTCYHVKYAAAFEPGLFQAAVVADGVDLGYSQYLFLVSDRHRPNPASTLAHAIYGGNPFAGGRAAWLAKAPAFNVEKVSAAFLIQATGERSLYGEWEFFAGLRALGKPTQLYYFRDPEHPLIRPGPRFKSQELTKDWITFWLLGREDPDPEKAPQYARWRKLRQP